MKKFQSLFWRLLLSYLLVIAAGSFTLYVVSQTFAPILLDQHVETMMQEAHDHTANDERVMLADLQQAYSKALRQSLAWSIGIAALVASIIVLFVTSKIVTPLQLMKRASQRISSGHYKERLGIQAENEIGELAQSFNVMAETLDSAEELRIELMTNLAHEFKTPMNNLKGYFDGLEDGLFEPNQETYGAVQRQLARLEHLMGDLSLLSRVESGVEEVNLQLIKVKSLLKQTVSAFKAQYDYKKVDLSLSSVPNSLTVFADFERTQQVLNNLLQNALKHTPAGGEVHLFFVDLGKDIEFIVEDSGEGIPLEDQPFIFKRFYRADKARQHDGDQGSGIGLTIAKHYVDMQGGSMYLKASSNEGSSFGFRLPKVGSV